MSIPQYEEQSQTIAVLEGFISLLLQASPQIQAVLGKPLGFNDQAFYDDGVIGVYVMTSADKPDMAVTVSTYVANPNIAVGLTQYAVQVRVRGGRNKDARPCIYMLDTFREPDGLGLNGMTHVDLGGYNATIITSQSLGDMGLDSNDRYEMTENYYLIVNDEPGKVLPFPRTE